MSSKAEATETFATNHMNVDDIMMKNEDAEQQDRDDEQGGGVVTPPRLILPSTTRTSSTNLIQRWRDEGGGDDDDDDDGQQQQEEGCWELTWPIWHMLPRHERKELANRSGFKTIGEFEEYMSLRRAFGETSSTCTTTTTTTTSTTSSTTTPSVDDNEVVDQSRRSYAQSSSSWSKPYDNQLIYHSRSSNRSQHGQKVEEGGERRYEEEDESVASEEQQDDVTIVPATSTSELLAHELIERGGLFLLLPEDLLHRLFAFLPVDTYAILALVSPHWKSFTRTEHVYKKLCERLYLNQSKRRALHVSRFGNSFRTMLEERPRVRAGGGVYVLKYTRIQPIQRDMWTEIPRGAVLEHVYYRYLYFQENGRVLYALTTAPPHEMFRRFRKLCLMKDTDDDAAVWGTYQVRKRTVTVTAQQPWQFVQLQLTIEVNYALHGRYGVLSFNRHVTNTSGGFCENAGGTRCPNSVEYDVPEEPFRFVRDKRL